jgi:cell shape-determining protein MreC
MNFHSAKKKKEQKKLGLAFFVIVFLVILGFSGIYRWLSSGFHPLASAFWSMGNNEDGSLSFVLKDKKNLQRQVQDLENELRQKDIEIMRLRMFEVENNSLKDIVSMSSNAKTAAILIKPNYTLYDTLIIDAGVQDGIQEGDLVVGYGTVALGKIVDVRKNISFVELFTESEISSVLVHNQTATYIDAVGHGGGMVKFTVPRDISITIGDILSLPARNGLLFGTIEEIQFEATDPVQTVFAQSAVNINQIQFVEVIPGYEEQF